MKEVRKGKTGAITSVEKSPVHIMTGIKKSNLVMHILVLNNYGFTKEHFLKFKNHPLQGQDTEH